MGKGKVKQEPAAIVEVNGEKQDISTFEHYPELWVFYREMGRKMELNRQEKGTSWKLDKPEVLVYRLRQEVTELETVLEILRRTKESPLADKKMVIAEFKKAVKEEAADIANFAMMIADVAGNLLEEDV